MAPTKLTPAQKQEILQLYSQMSNADLAAKFGVSISTIARVIKEGKEAALIQSKRSGRQAKQLSIVPKPEETEEPEVQPVEDIAPIDVLEELVGDDDFGDVADLEEEEEEAEEEEGGEDIFLPSTLTILPLAELGAPETCYLVVDRSAEIVTRPLRDFRELGQLPPGQEHKPTLPIFRNHRLARRFSTPQQRIIKMPGYLLRAAQEKLRQKGISYILLNGRVYSL